MTAGDCSQKEIGDESAKWCAIIPANMQAIRTLLHGALLMGITALSLQATFLLEWKPVDAADLTLKEPRVEKDADAEALFWDVWVMDELAGGYPHSVLSHYIRLKIFTERGRDAHSTVDLPYFSGKIRIADVGGRTIKADGTILELKKDAVFDRTLVKAGGIKVQAKSFAMPGVEPGAIIEYRWREYRDEQLANYVRLPFQREFPVEMVRYHIKPLQSAYFPYGMRTMPFHCHSSEFAAEKDGFYVTSLANVPALSEEPHMPPENMVSAWMLVYYSANHNLKPEQYWKTYGKSQYERYKPWLKVNGEVKSTAESIVNGAASDEERLRRLFAYCRTKIKNLHSESVSAEERADASRNKTPADTIKQGAGTGFDIDMAFAALATAAGFDTHVAQLGDRSDMTFNTGFADSYFLRGFDIAVNLQGKWLFFDPASTYIPYGMLSWREEAEDALILDAKEPQFVKTPLSPPERSRRRRTGQFTLAEDGTLEGSVRLEYTGHEATARRYGIQSDSAEQRMERVREMVKNSMNTAEVSEIQVENETDPEKPLVYAYHVKVPGYAQRTGKRLFLQMAYFQFNSQPMFSTATRKYPIYFDYPWSEDDSVEIQMPAGFELDHAEAPGSLTFGDAGKYDVQVAVTKSKKLLYTRKFSLGEHGLVQLRAEVYPQVKQVFDRVHEADNHALTLKKLAQDEAPRAANISEEFPSFVEARNAAPLCGWKLEAAAAK